MAVLLEQMYLFIIIMMYMLNLIMYMIAMIAMMHLIRDSNILSWLTGLFLPMDMSILTKGSRHVFFDQLTWLQWLI